MKFLPLLLANLRRKKVRTLLTIGSFVVALFLFGLLAAIRAGFNQGIEVAGADRLVVINKVSLIQPLPICLPGAHRSASPASSDVTYATWFGGVYQDDRELLPAVRDRPRALAERCTRSSTIDEAQWQRVPRRPAGCVVGPRHSPSASAGRSATTSRSRARLSPGATGSSTCAASTRASGRRTTTHAVLVPAEVLRGEGARVLQGHRGLVRGAYRQARRRRRDGEGDRRGVRELPLARPAPRRRRPSPPASSSRWATSSS